MTVVRPPKLVGVEAAETETETGKTEGSEKLGTEKLRPGKLEIVKEGIEGGPVVRIVLCNDKLSKLAGWSVIVVPPGNTLIKAEPPGEDDPVLDAMARELPASGDDILESALITPLDPVKLPAPASVAEPRTGGAVDAVKSSVRVLVLLPIMSSSTNNAE